MPIAPPVLQQVLDTVKQNQGISAAGLAEKTGIENVWPALNELARRAAIQAETGIRYHYDRITTFDHPCPCHLCKGVLRTQGEIDAEYLKSVGRN